MQKPNPRSAIQSWIINHDDSALFVVVYIGLAVVLSITLGLFWLCAVVGVHYVLEVIRHISHDNTVPKAVRSALWEIKLDVALIIFAFLVSIYLDVVMGVAGLSAGARTVATAGSRFAAWQRIIRAVLLLVDDLAVGFKAAGKMFHKKTPHGAADTAGSEITRGFVTPPHPVGMRAHSGTLTTGDTLCLAFGAVCIVLLLIAPFVTDHSAADVVRIILHELRPFSSG